MKNIQVTQSSMPDLNNYIDEIKDLWESRWLTNSGSKHIELEQLLKKYLEVEHVALFTNGHLALEYIVDAFDLKGEVITTPFTFASTTHAVVRRGLTPVFCDIKENDYTIDPDHIENLITNKTCAIMPVHVYGNICEINRIQKIADKYNLKVIYDAAHAFGIKTDNKGVGSYGDASMFSFHATKVFNTIEGGALTFNDPFLEKRLCSLKNFGISGLDDVEFIGGNAKMNEFQAAMGLCNLKEIENEIDKRRKIFLRYHEHLSEISCMKVMKMPSNVKYNYSYYPVLFDGYKKSRDNVFEELKNNGIMSRKYFYPLTCDFACYAGQFDKYKLPIARYVASNILTLPLYADLELDDVDRICQIILQ